MTRQNLFVYSSRIEATPEQLFRWHAEAGALERLSPPWEKIEIVDPSPGIRDGDKGTMRVRFGPLWIRWSFEHLSLRQRASILRRADQRTI
jgi:hypothetical protein